MKFKIIKGLLFISVSMFGITSWASTIAVTVLDKTQKPIEQVIISLHGENLPKPAPMDVELVQEKLMFGPQHLIVTEGSNIRFINKDEVMHHVYSFSKTWKKQFRLSQDQVKSYVFDEKGNVVLGCNIHDWMLGYIYVMDSHFYGYSNSEGQLVFNDVPLGTHTVRIQNPMIKEGGGILEKTIVVSGDTKTIAPSLKLTAEAETIFTITFQLEKKLLPARSQLPNLDTYP